MRFLFSLDQVEFLCFSFTGASNARSDGMCVITVTYSTCLVCKIMIIRRLDFSDTKAIVHGRSANIHQFLTSWMFLVFSSFTGASNAGSDGMRVVTVTYSTCLVCKIDHQKLCLITHTCTPHTHTSSLNYPWSLLISSFHLLLGPLEGASEWVSEWGNHRPKKTHRV